MIFDKTFVNGTKEAFLRDNDKIELET